MKKFAIFAVAIAAILLLLPPVVGSQAESRIEASLANSNEMTGGYVAVSLEDYEKGWFSSSGKLRFRLTDAYIEANPLFQADTPEGRPLADAFGEGLTQAITVNHGPLLFGESQGVGLGEVISTWDGGDEPELKSLLAKTGNDYFLRSRMTIGLTGMGDLHLDAPAFTVRDVDDDVEEIVFAGASASGSIDMSDTHVVLSGQMNGFSVTGGDGEAVVERMRMDLDVRYPESDPYGLGSAEVIMDRIVALSADATAIDLKQAKIGYSSKKDDNGKVHVDITYAIGGVSAPGLDLEDLQVSFTMEQLDPGALSAMQRLSDDMMPADPAGADPLAAMAAFNDPIYDLLAGGMGMRFDPMRFTYDDQAFDARLNIQTKSGNLPPKDAFSLDNPLIFMNLFAVDADLSLDKNLALLLAIPQLKEQLAAGIPEGTDMDDAELEDMAKAQAPMMLAAMVAQGYIRDEGANYSVSASFDNGALTVNGNPIPLGALMGAGG